MFNSFHFEPLGQIIRIKCLAALSSLVGPAACNNQFHTCSVSLGAKSCKRFFGSEHFTTLPADSNSSLRVIPVCTAFTCVTEQSQYISTWRKLWTSPKKKMRREAIYCFSVETFILVNIDATTKFVRECSFRRLPMRRWMRRIRALNNTKARTSFCLKKKSQELAWLANPN